MIHGYVTLPQFKSSEMEIGVLKQDFEVTVKPLEEIDVPLKTEPK
jgi:hypothetical protein